MSNTAQSKCPNCGKRIAAENRKGSLTSYLFGALNCSCGQEVPRSQSKSARHLQIDDDPGFCAKCGLRKVSQANPGSITEFLFQSTRCKCQPDSEFADGRMSERFLKLKQTDSSTIFLKSTDSSPSSARATIDLAPGAVIGGVYSIVQLLGRGGMGEVYLARHEALGRKCALKVIPPEQVTEEGWLRFKQEATAVAKLEHINLVRVTDLGIHEGCLPFYAMDLVEGKNLADMLAESGPMPLPIVLSIFSQVCDGIDCAHRNGILHRDIKPGNIMIERAADGNPLAKILDFGLAKLTRQDRFKQSLTTVGDVFGSPFYMSPEQCNGEKLDRRSDIYSLGCTMFECLAGRPPFTGNLAAAIMFSQMEANPPSLESIMGGGSVPPAMEVVIAKLLRKNPVERYQTMTELKDDLDRVRKGQEVKPFYINRGQATISEPRHRSFNSPAERTAGKRVAIMLAIVALVFTIASIFAIRTIVKPGQRNLAKLPSAITSSPIELERSAKKEDLDDYIENGQLTFDHHGQNSDPQRSQPPEWDGKPFYKGIELHDGKKYKLWHFPDGCSKFASIEIAGLKESKDFPAKGDVLIDLSQSTNLRLKIKNDPPTSNAVFKGLGDDNFSAVTLTAHDSSAAIEAAVPTLFKLQSVKTLTIKGSSDKVLPDKLVEITNCFPHLTSLTIDRFPDGAYIAKIRRIKQLESITLLTFTPGLPRAGPFLDGSTKLINLNMQDCPITKSLIDHLSNCPNLKTLILSKSILRDYHGGLAREKHCLDALPNLHHLEELGLGKLEYCEEMASALGQCKSLKKLGLVTSRRLTGQEVSKLRHDLPKTELTLITPTAGRANQIDRFKPAGD